MGKIRDVISVGGNELTGTISQVLQMFRKGNDFKNCGSGWLLLGDTLGDAMKS